MADKSLIDVKFRGQLVGRISTDDSFASDPTINELVNGVDLLGSLINVGMIPATDKPQDSSQARIEALELAIRETIAENLHLADGENCTLIKLKRAIGYE